MRLYYLLTLKSALLYIPDYRSSSGKEIRNQCGVCWYCVVNGNSACCAGHGCGVWFLLITSASACDIAFEDWPNVFMHYSFGLVIEDFACVYSSHCMWF